MSWGCGDVWHAPTAALAGPYQLRQSLYSGGMPQCLLWQASINESAYCNRTILCAALQLRTFGWYYQIVVLLGPCMIEVTLVRLA